MWYFQKRIIINNINKAKKERKETEKEIREKEEKTNLKEREKIINKEIKSQTD